MARRNDENDINKRLWYACFDGDVTKVEQLLQEGANKNWIGEGGKTPLAIAAYHNNSEVVEVLLRHGVDVNEVDESNRSALLWAAQFGHYDTAVVLINNGANINIATQVNRYDPLLIASHIGHLKIVELLIKNGASWNVTNKDGLTPVDLAEKENHNEVVKYLSTLDDSQSRYKRALSEGKTVKLEATRISIHGPPGSGKTCLQHLILNESPPQTRESTNIVTSAVRASTNKQLEPNENCIGRVDEDEFLTKLSRGLLVPSNDENIPSGQPSDIPEQPSDSPEQSSSSGQPRSMSESRRRFSFKKFFLRSRVASSPPNLSPPPPPPSNPASPVVTTSSKSVQYEIISRLSSETGSPVDETYLVRLIYCIDSGGQAAFHDIAPAFLRRNCLSIVTLRLIDKLDDPPNTECVICGNLFRCDGRNQFTNRHIVTSFARSLSSLSSPQSSLIQSSCQPNLLVVGTFLDKMEECAETLEAKNESLKDDLHHYKAICITTRQDDIIHPVNTLVANNRQEVASQLNKIITKQSPKVVVDVPFKWFFFQRAISKESESRQCLVLSRNDCREITCDLQMLDNTEDALLFFDSFGMLFYFPKVLPDIIFTDPDPLIKKVSDLVSLTFIDDLQDIHYDLPVGSHKKLKEKGLFDEKLINKLDNDKQFSDVFSSKEFLKLLLHLLIIATVPSSCYPHGSVTYFIPCVLPWKQFSALEKKSYSSMFDPIILSWRDKPIPYGLFTGLVNVLLSREQAPTFKLYESFAQCRNVISLMHRGGGCLFLVDEVSRIELYFTGEAQDCHKMLEVVLEGIDKTLKEYRYQLSESEKGFYNESCKHIHNTCGTSDDGRIKVTCDHTYKVIYLESPRQINWFRSITPPPVAGITPSPVAGITPLPSVADPSSDDDWLAKVDDTLLNFENPTDVYEVKTAVLGIAKWYDLGLKLELDPPYLEDTKATYKSDVNECRDCIMIKWMQSKEDASWRILCSALSDLSYVNKAKKIGKDHPKKPHNQPTQSVDPQTTNSSTSSSIASYSTPVQATPDISGLSRTSDVYQNPVTDGPHNIIEEYCIL